MTTVKPDQSTDSIRLGEVARGSVVPFQRRLCHRHRPGVHRRVQPHRRGLASSLRPGIRSQAAQRGLVDVEKVPSEKGPPRKVYSLNAQGQAYLEEFWRTWSFLTKRLEQLHEGGK